MGGGDNTPHLHKNKNNALVTKVNY